MRKVLWIVGVAIPGFWGCNYTVGECYYRDQGNGSAGAEGTVLVPGGVGGYGDAPPKQPQDLGNPAPDCNIVPGSPCEEKCLADYENAAGECGNVEDDTARRACQDGTYARYKSCRENCVHAAKTCAEMFTSCQDKGNPCTRQIEWGETLCAICQTDCRADRPYKYSECYKCGFK